MTGTYLNTTWISVFFRICLKLVITIRGGDEISQLAGAASDLSSIPKLGMQIGDVNLDGVEDVVAAEVCGYDV